MKKKFYPPSLGKNFPAPLWSLGFIALVILSAVINPLFEDETQYALSLGRFSADNFVRMWSFPQCGNFIAELPNTWWPGALATELLYSFAIDPFFLRLFGTLLALFNIALIYLISTDLAAAEDRRLISFFF